MNRFNYLPISGTVAPLEEGRSGPEGGEDTSSSPTSPPAVVEDQIPFRLREEVMDFGPIDQHLPWSQRFFEIEAGKAAPSSILHVPQHSVKYSTYVFTL